MRAVCEGDRLLKSSKHKMWIMITSDLFNTGSSCPIVNTDLVLITSTQKTPMTMGVFCVLVTNIPMHRKYNNMHIYTEHTQNVSHTRRHGEMNLNLFLILHIVKAIGLVLV